jgi:diaminopimelate epimerase
LNCDIFGEPVGIRTRDLLIKSQLLYQLSYRPTQGGCIETSLRAVKGEIGEIQGSLAKSLWAGYRPLMMETKMPDSLAFMKMHGLGNDFVVIDSRGREAVMTAGLARAIGDRHRGVGFDQLAEIRDAEGADFGLDFWNSDGSMAAACGNATRCVCDFIMAERGVSSVLLVTARGNLSAVRRTDGLVSVNMGVPQLDWAEVPLVRRVDTLHLPLPGDPVAVGMGNPHAVFFVENAESVDLSVRGPEVENDPLFPQRTNVEFVSVTGPDRMRMRVWERGAGVTLACGSGVCAVTVAAHLRGLTGKSVKIDVDGGMLAVDWQDDGVWLTGPTAHGFDGMLSAAFLAAHR